ncbi:integrase [Amycolatopsis antarctica]|uniref:Integrase n=2 Tax=Amycolatopsis antarctica TaxID=1854586 RepID=A0A263D381_9PSEU|nr:integrase [Amycolatopsis antarctica]
MAERGTLTTPPKTGHPRAVPQEEPWPGVTDPARLLAEIASWLRGYGNHGTRRTYAEGLGLPTGATGLRDWLEAPDTTGPWAAAVGEYAATLGLAGNVARHGTDRSTPRPPPGTPGRLRGLHWFRWCAERGTDPLTARSDDVKRWLDALDDADAAIATRDRFLGTLKALYGHLADAGLVAANPAALNRRRLGLRTSGHTSSTVTLTTAQVRALYDTAAHRRRGVSLLAARRTQAIVGLFTLGLRVSELCALDRADTHVTRGRRALRVTGKGDKPRIVYLSDPAESALTAYLRERDATTGSASVAITPAGRRAAGTGPLIANLRGGRSDRTGVWDTLRRLARAAGDPLADVADRMHPHALRHFYVTTAVEAGAQVVHVQADVGHTSVDTTEQVYNSAARDPSRSAVDLVADAFLPPPSAG